MIKARQKCKISRQLCLTWSLMKKIGSHGLLKYSIASKLQRKTESTDEGHKTRQRNKEKEF